jgi:magnesium transporter
MITAYTAADKKLTAHIVSDALVPSAIWIDLLNITPEEESLVEAALGIDVPTREEMAEIETSSRLYREGEAIFMTAPLLAGTETDHVQSEAVTFILTAHRLVTVRYSQPKSFSLFAERVQKSFNGTPDGEHLLAELLDAIIDRMADALERIAGEINRISLATFKMNKNKKPQNFSAVLQQIGAQGDLNSKVRESLVSLGRVVTYFEPALEGVNTGTDLKSDIAALHQDVKALLDHASFLSGKINFLLEATLGMINIEQNAIIKFFSVAAVVFLPPTLIASIYGMNFIHMPELAVPWAYPLALCFMVLSAIGPYAYFKKRGWF